jgi:hypothetical protein
MGSPLPVQIGSYCADFIIVDPIPLDGPYYLRRIDPKTNRRYYLTINSTSRNYEEVESPIDIGEYTYDNTDFQIRFHWDKFLKIHVESGSVIPSNKLRYLSSVRTQNVNDTNIVLLNYDSTNSIVGVRVRTSTGSDTLPKSLNSYRVTTSTNFLDYDIVSEAPDTVKRSPLMFLVNDSDDNNNVVTPSTRMRYLIVDPTPKPPSVSDLNLFLPRVTEEMVKRTKYRFNRKINLGTGDVSYSFDVFRSSTVNAEPTTSSPLNYVEIDKVISQFAIDNTQGEIIEDSTTNVVKKGTKVRYTLSDGTVVKYTATDMVFDKTISDLYGDFSLGLFKIVDASGSDTGRYLGYDCLTPSATGTCSTTKQLISKDYNVFRNPSYSCQFRLYDLGNNEYMIYVTDPDDINSRLMIKPDSTGALTFTKMTALKEERGWQLEQIDAATNKVRIKWNYPSSPVASTSPTGKDYLLVDSSANTASMGSITETGKTSVYICIRCSRVDPGTGTCSSANMVYVDDDLNYATPPVMMSPLPINTGQAPVFVDSNMRILDGSNALEVTDDGIVSYKSSSTQRFFTTQTGVLTTTEKNTLRVFFLGKQTSTGGEYMYAKYTDGQDLKFVVATNPNPADGFGWIITENPSNPSQSEFRLYQPGSPSATTIYLKNGVRYLTIERNFSATLGSYNPETNQYTVNFSWNGTPSSVDQSNSPSSGFTSVGSTVSTKVNATPQRIVYFRGTTNSGDTSVSAISIPDAPAPSIVGAITLGNQSSTSFDIQNINVTNMNSSGTMEITAMSPSLPATRSYTYASTITVSGLTPLTTYSGIGLRFTNTVSNKQVSTTIASTILTNGALSSVTLSGSTLTYTLTTGTATLQYVRSTTSTKPANPSWLAIGTPVSTAQTTSGQTTTVTISITPDLAQQYYYFFKVNSSGGESVEPTGSIFVNKGYNAAYMSTLGSSTVFFIKYGSDYVSYTGNRVSSTQGNPGSGNMFNKNPNKKYAASFSLTTDYNTNTYKSIRFNSTERFLRHYWRWIYDSTIQSTNADFGWKFEDSTTAGALKIRNQYEDTGQIDSGLNFENEAGVPYLINKSPFSTGAGDFTVEVITSVVNAAYMNSGAGGYPYILKTLAGEYIGKNDTADINGVDIRFWRKSSSERNNCFKFYNVVSGSGVNLGLAQYDLNIPYTGTYVWFFRNTSTTSPFIAGNWIYKKQGTAPLSDSDSVFKFVDISGGGMQIMLINPSNGSEVGRLGFVNDGGVFRLKVTTNSAEYTRFNVEF